jgi:hypothetical protein
LTLAITTTLTLYAAEDGHHQPAVRCRSAHVSPRDLKPALLPVMAASVLRSTRFMFGLRVADTTWTGTVDALCRPRPNRSLTIGTVR